MDEMRKVLEAYNTVREYCRTQNNCEKCILSDESDICLLYTGDVPKNWQEFDLD
ncbi:MAG: hypothetical protein HDR28_02495 [Lachnospiraceae bacterium]|nr:hypothetical protein [Lachnospiraceae bacterium]